MDDIYEMAFWFTLHNRWPVFLFVLHLVFGSVYIWVLDVRVIVTTICLFPTISSPSLYLQPKQ